MSMGGGYVRKMLGKSLGEPQKVPTLAVRNPLRTCAFIANQQQNDPCVDWHASGQKERMFRGSTSALPSVSSQPYLLDDIMSFGHASPSIKAFIKPATNKDISSTVGATREAAGSRVALCHVRRWPIFCRANHRQRANKQRSSTWCSQKTKQNEKNILYSHRHAQKVRGTQAAACAVIQHECDVGPVLASLLRRIKLATRILFSRGQLPGHHVQLKRSR